MSFWSRPSTTTGLLAVIAGLLLVLVIQNGMKGSSGPMPSPHGMMPPPMSASTGEGAQLPPGHPPMGGSGSMQGGQQDQNFDPVMMIYSALSCPGDATLTLDSSACEGKEADERRDFARQVQGKEASIRGVFDSIVKKYGENALSEQARAIRKMRKPTN